MQESSYNRDNNLEVSLSNAQPSGRETVVIYSGISALILALCLPSTFFALRALLPFETQERIYAVMLRHSAVGEAVSIAFVMVFNLGFFISAAALILNIGLFFIRDAPAWVKTFTSLLFLSSTAGDILV